MNVWCKTGMATSFTLTSCVRGYHVCKDIWNPTVGETLNCERKARNSQDPYMVCLRKDDTTVGHVPCVISCICTLFVRHGGFIKATVTGPWQCSQDLLQGGLELPYMYRFTGEEALTKKAHQLLHDEHDDGVSEVKST